MKIHNKYLASILAFAIIAVPFIAGAAGMLTVDCNVGDTVNGSKTGLGTACDFNALMGLVNKIIDFLLFIIATPLAALAIAYAGWLMISSGGSSEKVTKAKNIMFNLVIGYIIALAAWLIVHTILIQLGFNGEMYLK